MTPGELTSALSILLLYAFGVTTERLWPRNQFPSVAAWIPKGIAFVALLFLINAIVPALVPTNIAEQLIIVDGRSWGVLGGALFGIVTISFLDYWYHRASHRYDWLWRAAHKLHHSVQRVDTVGFVYTHPLEITIFAVENLLVLQIFFPLHPGAIAITTVFVAFCGMFQHWNVRTPRWIGYIIQRPESHCYHHERNVHAWNYANIPIWDILFGTFKNPESFAGQVGFDEEPAS